MNLKWPNELDILFLTKDIPDYLHDAIFLGLHQLGCNVVDLPAKPSLHGVPHPSEFHSEQLLFDLPQRELRKEHPDLMIIGSILDDYNVMGPKKWKEFVLETYEKYKPEKVIILDCQDSINCRYPALPRDVDHIFKRELSAIPHPNWHPIHFAAIPEPFEFIPVDQRTFDVSFIATLSNPYRTEVAATLKKYCRELGLSCRVHVDKKPIPRSEYLKILSQSKTAISVKGAGQDCYRYWEIPSHGTYLIADKSDLVIDDDFEAPWECNKFQNTDELKKILELLAKTEDWRIQQGILLAMQKVNRYHTPVERARQILDRVCDSSTMIYDKPATTVFHEDWYGDTKPLLKAYDLVKDMEGRIIEIGCWEGKSTIALANACFPQRLEAVDTWQGNVDEDPNHETVKILKERDVFATFQSNIKVAAQGNVDVFKQDCFAYLEDLPQEPCVKFSHLDASHDYVSVKNAILLLQPLLVKGGVICGDDIATAHKGRSDLGGGVERAVEELCPGYKRNGNFWYWVNRKPKSKKTKGIKHLFLVIPNNSGSTYLQNVIGDCELVAALSDEGQHVDGFKGPHPVPLDCTMNWTICPDFSDDSKYEWDKITKAWNAEWKQIDGAKVFLEKSPPDVMRAQLLEKHFDNAHFIIMTRNPYAAIEGCNRATSRGVVVCAQHFAEVMRWQKQNIETLEQNIFFTYEELCKDPDGVKQKLVEFIPELHDVDFTKEVRVRGYNMPLTNLNFSQIARLSEGDIQQITWVLSKHKDLMDYFGYKLV